MSHPAFDPKELEVVEWQPGLKGGPKTPVFNYPISIKEEVVSALRDKDQWWVHTGVETKMFTPSIIPDNCARGFVFEYQRLPREKFGGKDMFGVEWDYIDMVGGSMVRPGKPLLTDVNDWKEVVKMPDIDAWDWEGSAKANEEYLNQTKAVTMTLLNGCWFERLISFMDFEGAAMALLDEDQEDALKEMTHELTSLYINIVDHVYKYFGHKVSGINIHDDWGSQRSPFFSDAVARNFYLPEMKRFVEHVHSLGYYCDLHSCGHIEDRCGIFVEAGFDSWAPMPMNDTIALYDKYGDKIMIGVVSDKSFDPETATEEEQRECAREFVKRFCKKGTMVSYSAFYNKPGQLTQAFREELYKASREAYNK